MSLFYGIHVSQTKSMESDYSCCSPEPFFNIMLPIGENKTLTGCFDLFTKKEELGEDNKLTNDKTGEKELVTKQIKFLEST